MRTIDVRLLVDGGTDAKELTRRLVGQIPWGANCFAEIYGAAELDEQGVPVPQFPLRPDVEWDGWPRETTRYSMSMSYDPESAPAATQWQTIKVYAHNGTTHTIVAADNFVIRDGKPGLARVASDDGLTVYVSDGEWEAAKGTWACPARVEVTK